MNEERNAVLLAEDNVYDAELMMRALGSWVRYVEWVRDGVEAVACARANTAARVLLLDLKMPRMDGFDVLRELRGEDDTRAMPIVVTTSSSHDRDIAEAYRLGANGYIVKPVDADEFNTAVEALGRYWLGVNRVPRR